MRDGYASTTIASIAEEADVAVQTVYAVFSNKRTVLTELLAARLVDEPDEEADSRTRSGTSTATRRADWRDLEREANPERQVAALATIATRIGARMAPLYGVLAQAAGSDPDIAELYRQQQETRYRDQRRLARSLARKHALKPGLTETRATDIMWAIANPNTYRALVDSRGWSDEDYEPWLAELLASTLLRQKKS